MEVYCAKMLSFFWCCLWKTRLPLVVLLVGNFAARDTARLWRTFMRLHLLFGVDPWRFTWLWSVCVLNLFLCTKLINGSSSKAKVQRAHTIPQQLNRGNPPNHAQPRGAQVSSEPPCSGKPSTTTSNLLASPGSSKSRSRSPHDRTLHRESPSGQYLPQLERTLRGDGHEHRGSGHTGRNAR